MGRIDGYLGFAVKSGKIIYGIDNIKVSRKKIYLLVLSPDASENLTNEAHYLSKKLVVDVVTTDEPLETIINKNNCKLAALLDSNMARAVADNIRR